MSPGDAIIEVAEEPIRDLAHLRDVAPPPALVARVMTRVAEPVTPTAWQWLWRPVRFELHVSPAGIVALATLVGAGLALFFAR
ncbi:MAG TPA: hypothetical protein VHJ20_19250 [Polyangia bacterium]|nr:hypothetical protein [Polyangia bacterium]